MSSILVIDTGTSSMRGILFHESGNILLNERRKYFMTVNENGAAEQNPADFAGCLTDICTACQSFAAREKETIAALAFTSQRSSILPLTKDRKPMGNVITWYDKRSADICQEIQEKYGNEIYDISGVRPTPVLSAPKITWLKRNRPHIYEKADKIVGIHDYLIFLCTGRLVTDVTLGSRTCFMDIRKLCWSSRLLELFGVDREKLCELLPPGSTAGTRTSGFAGAPGLPAGTPVISAGGDQQCSVLGQGLFHPGETGVTTGTGAYLSMVCDTPVFDSLRRVNVSTAVTAGQWILEASTMSAGSAYDWFNRLFCYEPGQRYPTEQINREVSESMPGAGGVLMLPDLAGRGCPDWDDWARGLFYNLSLSTTRGDCARAVLEGIAYEIAECHKVLCSISPKTDKIRSTGGLANITKFNQMLTDMIEFPVERCIIEETTAIGAFLVATQALGWFASAEEAYKELYSDAENVLHFEPIPAEVQLYGELNAVRKQLVQSLPNHNLIGQLMKLRL